MLSLWANWLVTPFGLNSLRRYLWPVLYCTQYLLFCMQKYSLTGGRINVNGRCMAFLPYWAIFMISSPKTPIATTQQWTQHTHTNTPSNIRKLYMSYRHPHTNTQRTCVPHTHKHRFLYVTHCHRHTMAIHPFLPCTKLHPNIFLTFPPIRSSGFPHPFSN